MKHGLFFFLFLQSGLPAMNVEILSQFPSPPLPNLPALAMTMVPVIPPHSQPMMSQPTVSMSMPSSTTPVMVMTPAVIAQHPTSTNFIASFPPTMVNLALVQTFSLFYFFALHKGTVVIK